MAATDRVEFSPLCRPYDTVIQERPRPRTKQRVSHCVKADALCEGYTHGWPR